MVEKEARFNFKGRIREGDVEGREVEAKRGRERDESEGEWKEGGGGNREEA